MTESTAAADTLGCEALPTPGTAEHNMVMPEIRRGWTTDDVRGLMHDSRTWPRYELIDGELFVTPAPSACHQIAVSQVHLLLAAYVDRERLGVALTSPADLELAPGTLSQPDVFVVPAARHPAETEVTGWEHVTSLLLAVEILSPSSLRTDRIEKREHYMSARVAEYWVVDLDARVIERWTGSQERPVVCREEFVWLPVGASAALTVHPRALFDDIARQGRLIGGR